MPGLRDFLMPDLGEGLTEGEITRWLVAVGDTVTVDQPIAEISTEKAIVEVPTPFAGRVATLHGVEGDLIAVGTPLISIEIAGGTSEAPSGNVLVGYGTSEAPPRTHRAGTTLDRPRPRRRARPRARSPRHRRSSVVAPLSSASTWARSPVPVRAGWSPRPTSNTLQVGTVRRARSARARRSPPAHRHRPAPRRPRSPAARARPCAASPASPPSASPGRTRGADRIGMAQRGRDTPRRAALSARRRCGGARHAVRGHPQARRARAARLPSPQRAFRHASQRDRDFDAVLLGVAVQTDRGLNGSRPPRCAGQGPHDHRGGAAPLRGGCSRRHHRCCRSSRHHVHGLQLGAFGSTVARRSSTRPRRGSSRSGRSRRDRGW